MTKIFLDSGDPQETEEAIRLLGSLDGQTTNPTLIAKNPYVKSRLERGEKFTRAEIYRLYREVVQEIAALIPRRSVSVEVYADSSTTMAEMLVQADEMFTWIPSAYIKLPITHEGLKAAEQAVKEGMRVNMTLCFSQEQAAAVYAATKGTIRPQVLISPFVGRLDDINVNGMDLIENITWMYNQGNSHVEVLTASIRNLDHLLTAFQLKSDIVTVSLKVLKEWGAKNMPRGDNSYVPFWLDSIPYYQIDLQKHWTEYDIENPLTKKGLKKFADDWNRLIK